MRNIFKSTYRIFTRNLETDLIYLVGLSVSRVSGIALLTVGWQSWQAATRNPVEALKYE